MRQALVVCVGIFIAAPTLRGAVPEMAPLSLAPEWDDPQTPATVAAAATLQAPPDAGSYGITGNWFGAREALGRQHIFFGGFVYLEGAKNLRGGLDTEAWPLAYLLDLHATADIEAMTGWSGATAYADFQSHDQSGNGDIIVGDIQGYDNLTAPRFVQIQQLWYKQDFAGLFRLKIGKADLNGDAATPGQDAHDGFSLLEHSADFLQSGAVYSPTMFAFPTYPDGAPGVALFAGKETYLAAGAYYGNRDQSFLVISGAPQAVYSSAGGMFFIGELGSRWTLGNLPGHAGAGGWFHNGKFVRTDGTGTSSGAGGGYAFVDQTLFLDAPENGPRREIGAFLLGGLSDKTTAPMDQSLALGLTAAGFVPGRPGDSAGVLCTWAHIPAQPGLLHPFELATEVYYRLQITPWASLKPDFQYIVSPSGRQPDAAVVTLRAEIDF